MLACGNKSWQSGHQDHGSADGAVGATIIILVLTLVHLSWRFDMRHVHVKAPVRTLSLDVRNAGRALLVVAAVITGLGWIQEVYILIATGPVPLEFLRLFDTPHSLTNWLQPTLLLIATGLLVVVAALAKQDADPQWRRWLALAGLFGFMSLDEAVNIDGHVAGFISGQLSTADPLNVLMPFAVIAAALGGYFTPLLGRIPRLDAVRFVCCAAIFVGGALGMEIVSQLIGNAAGRNSVHYIFAASVEETLETVGCTLFCLTLGSYVSKRWRGWSLTVSRPQYDVAANR
jgi:hypothetical protein